MNSKQRRLRRRSRARVNARLSAGFVEILEMLAKKNERILPEITFRRSDVRVVEVDRDDRSLTVEWTAPVRVFETIL